MNDFDAYVQLVAGRTVVKLLSKEEAAALDAKIHQSEWDGPRFGVSNLLRLEIVLKDRRRVLVFCEDYLPSYEENQRIEAALNVPPETYAGPDNIIRE